MFLENNVDPAYSFAVSLFVWFDSCLSHGEVNSSNHTLSPAPYFCGD